MRRAYHRFSYKDANFRIACDRIELVTEEIVRQRHALEDYIRIHPQFQASLRPVDLLPQAPEVAHLMADAARCAGVGPMAAVAGAMAQLAARAALENGVQEAIVENGGDIYIVARQPVTLGIFSGTAQLADRLAFLIQPEETPLGICSSSSRMGRSMSLGDCDLATVVARDAALADAAATKAANSVKTVEDIDRALNKIMAIPGVQGVLLVKNDRVGLMGRLPRLIRSAVDAELITGL
jgi:ApbE superfamily uncharacterized protein (UPF0280 family)